MNTGIRRVSYHGMPWCPRDYAKSVANGWIWAGGSGLNNPVGWGLALSAMGRSGAAQRSRTSYATWSTGVAVIRVVKFDSPGGGSGPWILVRAINLGRAGAVHCNLDFPWGDIVP